MLECILNQVGFMPNARKFITVRALDGEVSNTEFQVLNNAREVVYKGKLGEPKLSRFSDEMVRIGDFSEFKEEGIYIVQVGGDSESYPFEIGSKVYDEMWLDAFRMLYYQRCGCEVTAEYAHEFAHEECHKKDAIIHGTDKKNY